MLDLVSYLVGESKQAIFFAFCGVKFGKRFLLSLEGSGCSPKQLRPKSPRSERDVLQITHVSL